MSNRNDTFRRIVATLIVTSALASAGAMAADKEKCKAGEKYDAAKKECVKHTN